MEELWWMQRKHKFHFHGFLLSFLNWKTEKRMDTSQLFSAMEDPNQSSSSSGRRRRRSREIETTSLEIRKCPRDLFPGFPPIDRITTQNGLNHPPKSAIEEQEEDGEIELNLGLSLGGRFGVDKSQKGLIRASSIAGTTPTFREMEESPAAAPAKVAALARTASLPTETEEEWRRRKEIQTLRRMEAKRRRSEKQRSMKENNSICGEDRENGSSLNVKGKLKRQLSGQPGKLNPGSGSGQWVVAGGVKGKGGFFGSLQGLLTHQQQQQQQGNSQGSAESQGGCSSGVSELESKTHPGSGSNSCGETRSPANTNTTQDRGSQDPPLGSNKQAETSDHKKKEAPTSGIEDMPCVFTIGDGPNGRKVEGILYKYGKGEEVRIMCVCHGSFLSPAEFVKHAGGRDVEHPLKHIVVNPSPSPFY